MRAMLLDAPKSPLRLGDLPIPTPNGEQLLIRVRACGVCRTDLHIVDGEITHPKLPLVLGHQIVGTVAEIGNSLREAGTANLRRRIERRDSSVSREESRFQIGDRVGVPWLGHTCQHCRYCLSGKENLCDAAEFTGYNINGGYAEYAVADERFCFPIPEGYPDLQSAPLLCAGLIGYRSYKMTGDARKIGFYGFGAAAHILIQVACYQGREVYAFTRAGDERGQEFARKLGAVWAGSSQESPPESLDAAIIFAPVGSLVPTALRAVAKGGTVVCAGIHMSQIPAFPYEILWEERVLRSVANLTRQDGVEFLNLAPQIPIQTEVEVFPLAEADRALTALREGKVHGSAVLAIAQFF